MTLFKCFVLPTVKHFLYEKIGSIFKKISIFFKINLLGNTFTYECEFSSIYSSVSLKLYVCIYNYIEL